MESIREISDYKGDIYCMVMVFIYLKYIAFTILQLMFNVCVPTI